MTEMVLHGFRYSVYVRVARIALHERGLAYSMAELDPFDPAQTDRNPHPMKRIPVLDDGGFRLFETGAILDYLASFPGPSLVPEDAKARARMRQVQGIVDSYAYWPMVRLVYAAGVFAPATGAARDDAAVAKGIAQAGPVLDMLDDIAAEGLVLNGALTLADMHLAPMIGPFVMAPEGSAALASRPALNYWWHRTARRESVVVTDPGLPRRATEG